ncbi:MAG: zinc-ribbon domain-containing protein [Candidatus Helarchaeota archaeon]
MSLKELVTFKVTEEMKRKMKKFDNVNWSAWLRAQIWKKIKELEELERKSNINFCPQCGHRLLSPEDRFCRVCGAVIPH